jgi:hypothetical protein
MTIVFDARHGFRVLRAWRNWTHDASPGSATGCRLLHLPSRS